MNQRGNQNKLWTTQKAIKRTVYHTNEIQQKLWLENNIILFIHCFLDFLHIFKAVSLKSVSSISASKSFSGAVSVNFFLCTILSCFFVYLVIFFVEKWTLEFNNVVTLEISFCSFPRICCFLLLFLFIAFVFLIIVGCPCAEYQSEV